MNKTDLVKAIAGKAKKSKAQKTKVDDPKKKRAGCSGGGRESVTRDIADMDSRKPRSNANKSPNEHIWPKENN
jgi:hypothetical protein